MRGRPSPPGAHVAARSATTRRPSRSPTILLDLFDLPADALELDGLVAVVVDYYAGLAARLDARRRSHRSLDPEAGVVNRELHHRDLVTGARLCVRGSAADEEHRLVGDEDDRS